MIQVRFIPPESAVWKRWRNRALKATEQLLRDVAAGKAIEIAESLYKPKTLKQALFAAFHAKCAYCEFHLDRVPIDIEHYRPKRAVCDEQDTPVSRPSPAGPVWHGGYYWLAYDWENLLPCCRRCNQQPAPNKNGEYVGKGNRFPIAGTRAYSPLDDMSQEQPLLLHPVIDDPAQHLTLNGPTGVLGFRTPRGEFTIKLLGLNDEELVEMRKTTYVSALAQFSTLLTQIVLGSQHLAAPLQEALARFERGAAPFSMAGRLAIAEGRSRLGNASVLADLRAGR